MQKARRLSDVDNDAIFVPGGLALLVDMPEAPLLKQVVVDTYERQAVVGAVCHGPVALLNARLRDGSYLVKGKHMTSFTTAEEDNYARPDVPFDLQSALSEQGAIYYTVEPWGANSLADGNLVTGQNPASAKGVAQKMITIMEAASR